MKKTIYILMITLSLTALSGAKCSESKYSGNDIPHHDPVAWCANVSEYAAAGRCDNVDTSDYEFEKKTPPIQNLLNKF